MTEKITRELLLQAAARGWCSPANQNKEMDADLASAIVDEIQAAIRATEQPARPSGDLANEIANAKRFDRKMFDGDTDFADWAQSRARHYLRLDALAKGE